MKKGRTIVNCAIIVTLVLAVSEGPVHGSAYVAQDAQGLHRVSAKAQGPSATERLSDISTRARAAEGIEQPRANRRNVNLQMAAVAPVVDIARLDPQLRARWDAMKNALRSGNTALAASYIVSNKRAHYQTMFNNLTIPFSSIDQMLGPIIFQKARGGEVEYEMLMNDGPDGIVSYMVLFSRDPADGEWRVSFF